MTWQDKWLPWKGFCTMWPDGSWGECCENHDNDYKNPDVLRIISDSLLWYCIYASSYSTKLGFFKRYGIRTMSYVMFYGVRLFGWPFRTHDIKENLTIPSLGETSKSLAENHILIGTDPQQRGFRA